MRLSIVLLCALLVPASLRAATVDITVHSADGKPLAGAVILIDTPKKPAGPIHFSWGTEMAQRNIAFEPHVLIVPVGSTVTFPNQDKVRHHVYSFSRVKSFNLKLYGREKIPSVVFDKPGVVSLGCNIHDRMSGFIVVVVVIIAAPAARAAPPTESTPHAFHHRSSSTTRRSRRSCARTRRTGRCDRPCDKR